MKVLCMYLPQYHEVKENNEWWGQGYTEWNAVKNAKPLFKNHFQPRKPLDNNYYDLVKNGAAVWKWQAELAKTYHVFGFCIYHYWFEGKQLLEKPMEILRDNPSIKVPYCICWANESWRKNWYGQGKQLLMEQTYGDEKAWEKHFDYLMTFFQDERYIKIDNKPIINIYRSKDIDCLPQMMELWNQLAIEAGFNGIFYISGVTAAEKDDRTELFDSFYYFEPGYSLKKDLTGLQKASYLLRTGAKRTWNKYFSKSLLEHRIDVGMIYKRIENRRLPEKCCPGTFPQWDNTPRTGYQGLCYTGASPQLFKSHLKVLKQKYENSLFLYINAWNEWGEGAYLEPDEENKYAYLEAVRDVWENGKCKD